MSIMKQMVRIFLNRPERLFSLDELLTTINSSRKGRNLSETERGTIRVYLLRLRNHDIIQFVKQSPGKASLYRCKDPSKALAYIDGRFEEYVNRVTPPPPLIAPEGTIMHRKTYFFRLPIDSLSRVESLGEFRPCKRSPGCYVIDHADYEMTVWLPSLKAQVFLKGNWRKSIREHFGDFVLADISKQVETKQGHEGMAIPIDKVFNDPIYLAGKDGKRTKVVIARSQIKAGEVDFHGPEGNEDVNAEFIEWWEDKKFKADMLNLVRTLEANRAKDNAMVAQALDSIGSVLKELGKGQADNSQKFMELLNLLKGNPQEPPSSYISKDLGKNDYSYR